MSAFNRSIALAGAGAIGTHILRALLNHPNHPKVVVLTRRGSKKDLPSDLSSATVIPVDYTDVAALTALFKEHSIEVVISTVPAPGYVTTQHALADAAKASGSVKLFVPSDWGVPTEGAKEEGNLLSVKDEVADYLKSIGLPYTRIFTGLFMSFIPWAIGADVESSAYIQGTGKTPFTTTSEEDIGGFVAHVLTSLPLTSPDLVNACLRIQGQRITLQECAQFLNKSIVLVAEGESIPAKTDAEKPFKALVQTLIEGGMTSTGWDRRTNREIEGAAGSANKLWEGHVWQTVGSSSA
ncbi:hypothetical protein DFJ43DRAFT_1073771 [Lentinula guzmanii]|uniref:NmrA-like domain-containing protein n=1 Tax=Lentinula guzmanii TaxID=2804957 RepID=A0AA38N066_9AGAR|nr:hypothetical protein DFJ43DRAFT_1073771 [Lentinula guzmanii]